MLNIRKFLKAIGLVPNSSQNISAQGEMEYRSDLGKLSIHDGVSADSVVQEAKAATLTNKSISGSTNTLSNIPNSATTATAVNTPSAIVARDSSGNFSAGTISANLTGNVTGDVTGNADTATDFTGSLSGDVSGTQSTTSVDAVGGKTSTEVAQSVADTQDATSSNVVSTIVKRDASGNFSAGTITAALSGNATTATTATNVSGTVAIANGGTGQTTKQTAFDALSPTTTAGDMIYNDGTNNVRLPIGSSGQVLKVLGGTPTFSSFSGGINYMSANPDAEADTSGYVTYADAAGAQPVNGTGGSPTVTFTRTTSDPLRGSASFLFSKDAADRQGEGVSYDFTIDSADKAKVLTVSFDYAVDSGTYATGDMAVYLYDITNSQVIQPAGYQIENVVSGSMQQKATFQTNSNSTSYRLILHVASTSASAYSLKLDNFSISPQVIAQGTPVTDWTAYTPTFSNLGSVTGVTFFYRRMGDSIQIKGTATAGSPAAGPASFSLPAGMNINILKFSQTTKVGSYARLYGNSEQHAVITQAADPSSLFLAIQTGSVGDLFAVNGSSSLAPGEVFSVYTTDIAVAGWSSNAQMSSDAETRVVAFKAITPSGTLNGSMNPVSWGSVISDTHAGFSGGVYTVPVSGYYAISAELAITSASFNANDTALVAVYVNGSSRIAGYERSAGTKNQAFPKVSSPAEYLNAGDQVRVYGYSDGAGTYGGGTDNSFFTIARVSGPSQVAASETVSVKYSTSNSYSFGDGTTTTLDFDAREWDTHSAVTTGSNWKFVAPVSGIYLIQGMFALQGPTANTIQFRVGAKNTFGGESLMLENFSVASPGMNSYVHGSGTLRLQAGDFISINMFHNSGATITNAGSVPSRNWISIDRIGN